MTRQVYIETYGCQMNEYDSGVVKTLLQGSCHFSSNPEQADVILFNTCAVREKAEEKIFERLKSLHYLKKKNPELVFGVLGCMAQNLKEKLKDSGVAIVMGPDHYRKLPEVLQDLTPVLENPLFLTEQNPMENYEGIEPETSGIMAYLTIMRGCNHFCSFCVVPYTRGRERSLSPESITGHIKNLTAKGIKEVILLGQNVNSYHYEKKDFTDLVSDILEQTEVERIRFTSPHPKDFPERLLDLMSRDPRFCPSIHLPLQSGSSAVLERMKRYYSREDFLALVDLIRSKVENVNITTDVIVGFCGETEDEFKETLSLMEEVRFQSAFMFMYSERDHTLAKRNMKDDVSIEIKKERLERLIAMQSSISLNKNQALTGRVFPVLVEGASRRAPDHVSGRTPGNQVVVFPAPYGLNPGDLTGSTLMVRVHSCTSATLLGQIEEDFSS